MSGGMKKRSRAPMSLHEGVEGVLPPIVTSSLYRNASGRWTSVRLGMSKHQFIRDGNNSQEWCDGNYKMSDARPWVKWVWASLVNQFTFMLSLRMISVPEAFFLKVNALSPIWMEVSWGKSIQSLTSQSITLKHNTRTTTECLPANYERFERRHV